MLLIYNSRLNAIGCDLLARHVRSSNAHVYMVGDLESQYGIILMEF